LRFNFIKQSLIGASIITFAANVLSAFLGYFREAATANYFGTGSILDVFILAFTIPEIFTSIIIAVLPTALIPALNKYNNGKTYDESELFWCGLLYVALFLAIITILVNVFRGNILLLLASNISHDDFALGKKLSSIVSFFIFFRGLEFYFRGWLFEKKHFLVPVSSNIVLSLFVLSSLMLFYEKLGIEALAYGWLLGSILMLALNAIMALIVVKPRLNIKLNNTWLRLLFRSLVIISVIETISMVYPFIDRYLASRYLETGVISALRYAMVLIILPNRLFAIAYSTASFPWISDLSQNNEIDKLKKMYFDSIRMIFFVMGLMAVGVAVFANEILLIAFHRGAFNDLSLHLTSGPLRLYAIGIVFSSVYIYQMRYYYARMEYKALNFILLLMLIFKIFFSTILINSLQHNGLALATVIAWFVGFCAMSYDLSRRHNYSFKDFVDINSIKILVLNIIIIIFWLSLNYFWSVKNSTFNLGFKLIVLGTTGLLLYFGLARLFRISESRKLISALMNKLGFR